jgi:hypothetical protein
MTLVERLRFERLIGHLDIGPILSEAADALETAEKALERCRELFSEIRMDWFDPRDDIRDGWTTIDAALEKIRSGR